MCRAVLKPGVYAQIIYVPLLSPSSAVCVNNSASGIFIRSHVLVPVSSEDVADCQVVEVHPGPSDSLLSGALGVDMVDMGAFLASDSRETGIARHPCSSANA